jgi:magnesium chelatase family protein
MSFAKVHSGQVYLLSGRIVDVEVDLSRGLHSFSVIGLPDKAVEESRDRISAAIKNSGFESPKHKNQKVIISLSPAHLKKHGSVFDLAMALGYLLAAGDINFDPAKKIFLGELSLDGELRGTAGILPIVIEAQKKGFREVFLPTQYVGEATIVSDIIIYGVDTLTEVVDHLKNAKRIVASEKNSVCFESTQSGEQNDQVNLSEIKGQELAKRGLLIAAAGGHNAVMYGPPGTGKTMLAKAFRTLLPELTPEQILEVTSIHSIAGNIFGTAITHPPFRSPHHTSSHVALIGGGNVPRPGEITLAHRGVLFLDEFPEFERRVIEALRQPLEDKVVSISRAKNSAQFPANVMLIATMNPCPCGHFGNTIRRCSCTPNDITRYRKKISGPITDRIDLWIEVGPIEYGKLNQPTPKGLFDKIDPKISEANQTNALKEKIKKARHIQMTRFKKFEQEKNNATSYRTSYQTNSDIQGKDLSLFAPLSKEAESVLMNAASSLGLSMRAYHRVWKLARTIADLAEETQIKDIHMLEALQYRPIKEPDEN